MSWLIGRYWIVSARVKRVAAKQPCYSKPKTFKYPMLFDSFNHITWAARIVTAVICHKRTNAILIKLNEWYKDFFYQHCLEARDEESVCVVAWDFFSRSDHNRLNWEKRAWLSSLSIPLRTNTTISICGSVCCFNRNDSLSTRLILLRCVASLTFFFAITKPKRGLLYWLFLEKKWIMIY